MWRPSREILSWRADWNLRQETANSSVRISVRTQSDWRTLSQPRLNSTPRFSELSDTHQNAGGWFGTKRSTVQIRPPRPTLAMAPALLPAVRLTDRRMREEAGLTQRDIGSRLRKPQSWVHNCETANRRVDVTEFVAWCEACEVKPNKGFSKVLRMLGG